MQVFSTTFWKDAADRAVRTTAQTFLAAVGLDMTTLLALDWQQLVLTSLGAGALSLVTSVAATVRDGTLSPASMVKPASEVPPKRQWRNPKPVTTD